MMAQEKIESLDIMEVNSIGAVKKYVSAGIGISILPRINTEQELIRGELIALPWAEEDLETQILMLWHKDKWIAPTLKAFMDTTIKTFEEQFL